MDIPGEALGAIGVISGYLIKKWLKDIHSVDALKTKQAELDGQVKALREDIKEVPKIQMRMDAAWKQIDKNESKIERIRFSKD